MKYQYINDNQGKPLYVLVPVADFEELTADDDRFWEDIPTESDEFDEVLIPHEIVRIKFEKDVSQIAAWRIYRGLTQAEAAEKAGIGQPALSQIERKGSRPQAKTRELFAGIYDCHPDQLAG